MHCIHPRRDVRLAAIDRLDALCDWLWDYKVEAIVGAIACALVGFVAFCFIWNAKLNHAMVGKTRAALIEAFGPPTRTTPSGGGSDVVEWIHHEDGYFQAQVIGTTITQVWIPARDVIRRAVVRDGRVVSCEGGI